MDTEAYVPVLGTDPPPSITNTISAFLAGNWLVVAEPLISEKAGCAAVNTPVLDVYDVKKLDVTAAFVTANCGVPLKSLYPSCADTKFVPFPLRTCPEVAAPLIWMPVVALTMGATMDVPAYTVLGRLAPAVPIVVVLSLLNKRLSQDSGAIRAK